MAKDSSNKTVVRRVKASDSNEPLQGKVASKQVAKKESAKKITAVSKNNKQTRTDEASSKKSFMLFRPFIAIGHYFRDSWRELKQVQWPNRRATWALTLAVILFSLFFILMIMLFDWIFNFIMQEVIL